MSCVVYNKYVHRMYRKYFDIWKYQFKLRILPLQLQFMINTRTVKRCFEIWKSKLLSRIETERKIINFREMHKVRLAVAALHKWKAKLEPVRGIPKRMFYFMKWKKQLKNSMQFKQAKLLHRSKQLKKIFSLWKQSVRVSKDITKAGNS